VQVPPTAGHVAPAEAQVLFTQQPPLAQAFPAQHSCPGPPHAWHTLFEHEPPVAHTPPQHDCPGLPHG
jgi:hypothetical protein